MAEAKCPPPIHGQNTRQLQLQFLCFKCLGSSVLRLFSSTLVCNEERVRTGAGGVLGFHSTEQAKTFLKVNWFAVWVKVSSEQEVMSSRRQRAFLCHGGFAAVAALNRYVCHSCLIVAGAEKCLKPSWLHKHTNKIQMPNLG